MAALEKVYSCMSCGQQIKLERKLDNTGWIKYNLDGTRHADVKKSTTKQQQQPQAATVDNGPQISVLAGQVKELKETINVLILQIQMLRSEVKKRECSKVQIE